MKKRLRKKWNHWWECQHLDSRKYVSSCIGYISDDNICRLTKDACNEELCKKCRISRSRIRSIYEEIKENRHFYSSHKCEDVGKLFIQYEREN